jgi:hypothetical protein
MRTANRRAGPAEEGAIMAAGWRDTPRGRNAEWETAQAVDRKEMEKAQKIYIRKLQKLIQDSAFRKKLTRQFTADHSAFE